MVLFIISIIGLSLIVDTKKAAGWLVFIMSASSYLIANLSFKFNEEQVELMRCIKSLSITPKVYWWSKFYTSYLPVLWILFSSSIFFVAKFGMASQYLYQSVVLSIWISFSLTYFQTNFSLYSYPYGQYAPLWFNMYILLAALFFTTLLFPPLTIAFIIFGYLAIFRVLERIKYMEVF